jgi:2,3-bisphosphoglycerate-dependent phosphoglycerate mutase
MRALFFARHGESEANVTHVFANRGTGPGLTELGRRQARELGRGLASAQITQIRTSPLARARQTAEVIGDLLGLPCQPDEALREYDVGILEGTVGPVQWHQYAEMERAWLLGAEWDRRHPGGESYREIVARFEPFLRRAATHGTGTVLAVTHGGLLRMALPRLVAGIGPGFAHGASIPNCGVVEIVPADEAFSCRSWCGSRPP